MNSAKTVKEILFRFSYIFIPTFVGSIISYFLSYLDKGPAILIIVVYFIGLFVLVGLRTYYVRKREDLKIEQNLLENKKAKLLAITHPEISDIIKNILLRIFILNRILAKLSQINDINEKNKYLRSEITAINYGTKWKKEMIIMILHKICSLLKSGSIELQNVDSLGDFFKATIFEVAKNGNGKLVLTRSYEAYPPAMPHKATSIREEQSSNATSIICAKRNEMVIIEDIPDELKKETPRWEILYQGQEKKYTSMITLPIVTYYMSEHEVVEEKVEAVLTIDTNRKRFFKDDQSSAAYFAEFYSPFRILLSTIYSIDDFEMSLKKCLDNFR